MGKSMRIISVTQSKTYKRMRTRPSLCDCPKVVNGFFAVVFLFETYWNCWKLIFRHRNTLQSTYTNMYGRGSTRRTHTHRHHHFNRNALQYWRTFISFIGFMVDRIGIWKLINWSVNGPNCMRASWRTWSHFSVKSLPFCGIKLSTAAKLQYMYVYTPYCLHIACFLSNKIHLQSCTFYVSPTPFSLLINRSSQLRFMLCVVCRVG